MSKIGQIAQLVMWTTAAVAILVYGFATAGFSAWTSPVTWLAVIGLAFLANWWAKRHRR